MIEDKPNIVYFLRDIPMNPSNDRPAVIHIALYPLEDSGKT